MIKALASLPGSKQLIYTSTAVSQIPDPRFHTLRKHLEPVVTDDWDGRYSESELGSQCYNRTKRGAEQLVLQADGKDGIRSVNLRIGMAVVGPRDLFIAAYLGQSLYPASRATVLICSPGAKLPTRIRRGARSACKVASLHQTLLLPTYSQARR